MPARKKRHKDREKDKSRDFAFVLYEDDDYFDPLLLLELKSYKYNALGIYHDKDRYVEDDIDEDGVVKHLAGDLKKPHYHFWVSFPNNRYISGVSKELGIQEHLIQFGESLLGYAEYQLHWGRFQGPGKYVYDTEDLIGQLTPYVKSKLSNEPPEIKIDKIIDFINAYPCKFIDFNVVYQWSREQGYSGICLSRMNVIKEFIYIHNEKVCKAQQERKY